VELALHFLAMTLQPGVTASAAKQSPHYDKRKYMSERQYCVYIMCNPHNTVLYTGVTNQLERRVLEHRAGKGGGFTKKYNITKLVYVEIGDDINLAIAREKQIKAGSRKKKIELIESINPEWKDLFEEYFGN
jgi:putative endonuclease